MLFEEFYKESFKNTFRFFYYRGVDFSDIDDLVSECYIRFHTKYQDKLVDQIESKKILSGIAANILKEWQRKTFAHKIVELTDEISEDLKYEFYAPDDFDDDFGQKQLKLHEAIKYLNPSVKQVLELRFLQNKSRKETAAILQINEDQVHTYQKRGVKYLKDRLNGDLGNILEEPTPLGLRPATPQEGNLSTP